MKLNSIQILRGVAALLVVYEHSMDLQMSYGNSWQQHFFHLNNFGCIGVDLFFVISGFIITSIASNYTGASQGVYFLTKRFFRINPIYYILTLVYLPFIYFNASITSSDLNLNSIFDSLLILPISADSHANKPLLTLGWTLSFEWLFYLLFYILILCNVRQKALFLMGIIVLMVVFGYIFQPNDFRLIFITNPIMLEFLLGCIISYIYLTVKQIPVDIGFICLLVGVSCYLYLIIQGFGNIDSYIATINGNLSLFRFLLWGLPSSLIVAGCVILEKMGNFQGYGIINLLCYMEMPPTLFTWFT